MATINFYLDQVFKRASDEDEKKKIRETAKICRKKNQLNPISTKQSQ